MNRLCIDGLVSDEFFSKQLLMHLKKEEIACTDVHRLAAIIDVNMGLVGAENDCQKVRVALGSNANKNLQLTRTSL
jgi:hypothetical protein